MKLILLVTLALADEPAPEPVQAPTETVVKQALEMNEKLSEILARVEEMKSMEDTAAVVVSEPVKKVEPSPETK